MSLNHTQWRRSEYFSVTTLFIVLGWIWYASAKNVLLDGVIKDMEIVKPKTEVQATQLAAIKATVDDMQDDVKFIRRHMRP